LSEEIEEIKGKMIESEKKRVKDKEKIRELKDKV
jgi:hypothetical protein